jgi:hypothetical protein
MRSVRRDLIMKRRLLNLLTLVSLLLCVAVVVLWVRSYWAQDFFFIESGRQQIGLSSLWGGLRVEWYPLNQPPPVRWRFGRWRIPIHGHILVEKGQTVRALGDFAVQRAEPWPDVAAGVRFPHWAALSAAALIPAMRGRRWNVRRRRQRRGLCPGCGYDLRATHDPCPECGSAVAVIS